MVICYNEKVDEYLDYIEKEILFKCYLIDGRCVVFLYLGGGLFSFLSEI